MTGFFLYGCGDPQITISDRVVYDREQKDLYQKGSQFIPMNYLLGPGDELEVLYHVEPGAMVDRYRIDTEDTLRIEFFYYPVMNTTVKVRPDGRITLPLIGEVRAGRMSPSELAATLRKLYKSHILRPDVNVDVLNFNVKLNELREAITTNDRGQSRLVVVRPDGGVSLPLIEDVKVAGLTPQNASAELSKVYRKYIYNLAVTVAVLSARSNRAYIFGEVREPNYYELAGPTTVSQLVAMARGFTNEANAHQVVLVSRDKQGRPSAVVLDMDDIIGRGDIGADAYVNQYDVVFVPRTKLAQAALVADRLFRFIPAQFSFAYTYGVTRIE